MKYFPIMISFYGGLKPLVICIGRGETIIVQSRQNEVVEW